ncbi:MAG: hypothetical protein BWY63_01661 [Chloroflexi bacterium ADurb.Bin360]|nr:MAG: hypothetical protein BWY63_01661 [Chloroflexi bacterium ADurb.Bin360]
MKASTQLDLLRFILQQQGVEYAVCDGGWRIEAHSPGFASLAGSQKTLLGRRPDEIFDEFEGTAAELEAVAQRAIPQFQIPHTYRERPDGSSVYLTFTAVATASALLLIITDTTQEVQLMQRLMQERNEVMLLQQRLDVASGHV